jgi:hypothetical protein
MPSLTRLTRALPSTKTKDSSLAAHLVLTATTVYPHDDPMNAELEIDDDNEDFEGDESTDTNDDTNTTNNNTNTDSGDDTYHNGIDDDDHHSHTTASNGTNSSGHHHHHHGSHPLSSGGGATIALAMQAARRNGQSTDALHQPLPGGGYACTDPSHRHHLFGYLYILYLCGLPFVMKWYVLGRPKQGRPIESATMRLPVLTNHTDSSLVVTWSVLSVVGLVIASNESVIVR